MYTGRSLAPQIELPPMVPDFSNVPVISYSDFDREPAKPDTRSLGQRLMETRYEMINAAAPPESVAHCDQLLAGYYDLEGRIDAFISEQSQAHITRLEQKRAAIWAECRKLEDNATAAQDEIARLNATTNASGQALVEWRGKMANANNNPGFNSRFPSDTEIANWNEKRSAVRGELNIRESQHRDLQKALSFAQLQETAAAQELNELVEKLKQADSALVAAKQQAK
jgi:hypothetical protein